MTKNILVFGAGKSATALIRYLVGESEHNQWQLTVADNNLELAHSKIGRTANATAVGVKVEYQEQRASLIRDADLVISLLPPALHILVATDCLYYGRNLLTASYLDQTMTDLSAAIKNKGLLFLCEMGLDPGIDHMSALRLINRIKGQHGKITSFKSHCGGLLAAESNDNPWFYKISWNPRNIVRAGSSGAVFLENNESKRLDYEQIFSNCKDVEIENLGRLVYYPNRDSLTYMNLYKLEGTATFIRSTLRYPEFCSGWDSLVNSGLTNDKDAANGPGKTFQKWSEKIIPLVNKSNKRQLEFLGIFDNVIIPETLLSSADILQYLLEKKLMMRASDRDMVVMLHEIEYNLDNKLYKTDSLLVVEGENNVDTAMAKTVGLPLGIAASLILKKKILLTGLHIPILPEIYFPVLEELELLNVRFKEKYSLIN